MEKIFVRFVTILLMMFIVDIWGILLGLLALIFYALIQHYLDSLVGKSIEYDEVVYPKLHLILWYVRYLTGFSIILFYHNNSDTEGLGITIASYDFVEKINSFSLFLDRNGVMLFGIPLLSVFVILIVRGVLKDLGKI